MPEQRQAGVVSGIPGIPRLRDDSLCSNGMYVCTWYIFSTCQTCGSKPLAVPLRNRCELYIPPSLVQVTGEQNTQDLSIVIAAAGTPLGIPSLFFPVENRGAHNSRFEDHLEA